MNDDQLLRYSRHILLPEIGIEGQEKLLAAKSLIRAIRRRIISDSAQGGTLDIVN